MPCRELLASQILKSPRQWPSQEDPGPGPAPFRVPVWPCAHQLWCQTQVGALGLLPPCRGRAGARGQSGARQAQLKAPRSPSSLALPQTLIKGLAFSPRDPCGPGHKNPLPFRPPGLPSRSQPRSLPSHLPQTHALLAASVVSLSLSNRSCLSLPPGLCPCCSLCPQCSSLRSLHGCSHPSGFSSKATSWGGLPSALHRSHLLPPTCIIFFIGFATTWKRSSVFTCLCFPLKLTRVRMRAPERPHLICLGLCLLSLVQCQGQQLLSRTTREQSSILPRRTLRPREARGIAQEHPALMMCPDCAMLFRTQGGSSHCRDPAAPDRHRGSVLGHCDLPTQE
ncbi:serine protease hepsin isoform X4 [Canis lupus dingo]|uniref:serine protease hepsin isoform X4 n=1 Tax=Canis lupus dingo TaxID=286419 RepID=UPI0015F1B738|nr:serine protease hepsin isoform X4 [Canis lupus dingo]XP_035562990.1 serine protease hepsin isoform X4 [Canis lupus dingo]XP_048951489.1 serine protease hepsin isoform X4 [Canis lupus dingo]